MSMEVEIEGLKEAMARIDAGLVAGPVRAFMSRAAMYIEAEAKKNAPVDTGRLRTSITHEVDTENTVPQWAKVGSNLFYAPYMEYGTGLRTDGTGGSGKRHHPPGDALQGWAERHGLASGWAVASAIAARGGLEPRRYLRGALEASTSAIQSLLKTCSDAIGRLWSG